MIDYIYSYSDDFDSSTLESNESGEIISNEEYFPYGITSYSTCITGHQKFKRYSNKEKDSTGLYYYGSRYYDTTTMRWISSDSTLEDGLNLYQFCGNDPINYSDPDGSCKLAAGAAVIGTVIGTVKPAVKAAKLIGTVKSAVKETVKTAKFVSSLTPAGIIKRRVKYRVDSSIDESRKKILHGSHSPLETDYHLGHMMKMKGKQMMHKGGGVGASIGELVPLPGATIAGALTGTLVGGLYSKHSANISRGIGKKTTKIINRLGSNHPTASTAVSVAASAQLTTRMAGGGNTLNATAFSEVVVGIRHTIARTAPLLDQERTDIISHSMAGAELLKSESSTKVAGAGAIVAFGLEEKPSAKQTESIGHAVAIGTEWGTNSINDLVDRFTPEFVPEFVRSYARGLNTASVVIGTVSSVGMVTGVAYESYYVAQALSVMGAVSAVIEAAPVVTGAAYGAYVEQKLLGRRILEFD